MEVHHHSHTPRKKWTHYFWEFLMLFLAVFCGFLAEYQLEHVIEKKREKDYLRLFIQDLKADTLFFQLANKANIANQQRMDSLLYLLKSYHPGNPTEELYYHARSITSRGISVQYINRTFEQLKGSGGFRLIRKSNVLDSITLYYESLKELDIRISHRFERLTDLFRITEELFDGWAMNEIAESNFARPQKTPPLLSNNKTEMNKYITRLGYFKATDLRIIERIEQVFRPAAISLMNLVKKEYHLE